MTSPVASAERGSVTVWMMVVPLLIALLGGVTLDLWAAMATRGRVAAVADDAATAAATAVTEASLRTGAPRLDPSLAQQRGLSAVADHPDTGLVDDVVVVSTDAQVRVTVSGRAPLHLLRMIGPDDLPFTVDAVAAPDVRGG